MRWQIKCEHAALLAHPLVVHDAVVLSAVTTCSMQENDLLVSLAGVLVKDLTSTLARSKHKLEQSSVYLAFAPERRRDVDVFPSNVVLFHLRFIVCRRRTRVCIVNELQHASPNVCPASE